MKPWSLLQHHDPEIYGLIDDEFERQQTGLELIASENFASAPTIAAMGSILTNKYAEGLPGKRYYGGCEIVDKIEAIAINRAKQIFGSKFANVQPHSGAQANAAVFLTLLQAGDKILGMDLSHGGHLTHGSKVNFSGMLYDSHFYGVNTETGRLDYELIAARAREVKPKMIIAGASAYAREIDFAKFRAIADEVGAYLFVDMAHIAGLVAAGEHPTPVPHAHVTTTTTHKTLRGPRGGLILWNDEKININKSVFPGIQGGPLEHVIASKAVSFLEALKPEFKQYQKQVRTNAKALAEALVAKGFTLVSGGTDNHLMLLDLSKSPVSGKQMEDALDKAHITVNKNTVPNETRSPFVTSGIRIGTPAVTSRGMGTAEMQKIAGWIWQTYENIEKPEVLPQIKSDVQNLAKSFPLYPEWRK